MAKKGEKRVLTGPQKLLAKLRYEGELSMPEIHKKCGISDRQGLRWFKYPEVKEEMAKLGKIDQERAQRVLERASVKAAEKLEDLAEYETKDPQLAEIGRKAACNILDANKLQKSTDEEKGDRPNVNVYLVQLIQEFRRAASEADGQTRQSIIELLEGGNGGRQTEVGPSPVLLRKPLPSQSSERTS